MRMIAKCSRVPAIASAQVGSDVLAGICQLGGEWNKHVAVAPVISRGMVTVAGSASSTHRMVDDQDQRVRAFITRVSFVERRQFNHSGRGYGLNTHLSERPSTEGCRTEFENTENSVLYQALSFGSLLCRLGYCGGRGCLFPLVSLESREYLGVAKVLHNLHVPSIF